MYCSGATARDSRRTAAAAAQHRHRVRERTPLAQRCVCCNKLSHVALGCVASLAASHHAALRVTGVCESGASCRRSFRCLLHAICVAGACCARHRRVLNQAVAAAFTTWRANAQASLPRLALPALLCPPLSRPAGTKPAPPYAPHHSQCWQALFVCLFVCLQHTRIRRISLASAELHAQAQAALASRQAAMAARVRAWASLAAFLLRWHRSNAVMDAACVRACVVNGERDYVQGRDRAAARANESAHPRPAAQLAPLPRLLRTRPLPPPPSPPPSPPLPFFASLLRPLPQCCMEVDLALMGSADMAREHAHRARGQGADRRRRAEARNR
jgi:hypothetical protein